MAKLLSICIPTYEMSGTGETFLKESFDILSSQTFKDFDVVVSDHSKDTSISNVCDKYRTQLDIKYYKNTEGVGSSSANINNAISKAEGKLVKILFQDDFLYDENSLQSIVGNFDLNKDKWLVTASTHSTSTDKSKFFNNFYPKYNQLIHFGKNTISSPSVLTILNEKPLLFDPNLIWVMDCDYYKRCYDAFGNPKILNTICVVNRVGSHQVTNRIVNLKLKLRELFYILKKYYL